ncbi:MAG: MFS transporter [Candidatus Korarchaeota archaeon]|nr:MFS transporter [Candidatus Korarchaeota archaeon]
MELPEIRSPKLKVSRELLIVLASSLLVAASSFIYQPIWPFLVEEAGVDPATYGIIASGANVLEFLIRWTFAAFSSPALTFLIGSLGVSASSGLILLGVSPLIIFGSLALSRVGRALYIMGRDQAMSLLSKERIGTTFSSVRVSWHVGAILGPALGALLLAISTRSLVLSLGLFLGFMASLIALPMVGKFGLKGKGKIVFWEGSLTSEIKGIVSLTILNNFARNSFFPFHLVLAPTIFGARVEHVAIAVILERLASILAGIPVGWLSDRIEDRRLVLAMSELFMVSGIVVYIIPSTGILGFLSSAALLGLGMASYAPVAAATVSEMAPKNPQDAVAFLSTAKSFSRLPAPLIMGALISAFGYSVAFSFSALCLAIVGISMTILVLRRRRTG